VTIARMGISLALAAAVAAAAGCSRNRRAPAAAPEPPRVEDMSWGPVELKVSFDPPRVRFDRDVVLTVRVAAPSEIAVDLPPLRDRLSGFAHAGEIDQDPVTHEGKTVREQRIRLTPLVAAEHRLAPFAVSYTDSSASPPRAGWFATRAVRLDVAPPAPGDPPRDIEPLLTPIWVYPSFRAIMGRVGLVVGAAALVAGALYLYRRLKREALVRRMSPRERALRELSALLAKDLIAHDHPKEFYLELTMIVRRYIERQHAIRAPEQTTEEFLVAVSRDPRFPPPVLARLRAFLEAADLVKFAAHRPAPESVRQATGTAKVYIQTDAGELSPEGGGASPSAPPTPPHPT
jgi:hypothetical protein